MRKDTTPRVETRELDDSDLDNVAGGLGAGGYVNGYSVNVQVGDAVGMVSDNQAASQAAALGQQVAGQATGFAGEAAGLVSVRTTGF